MQKQVMWLIVFNFWQVIWQTCD